ncbi:MAG: hypothetical protein IKP71_07575, partial [Candidatus Riflebacteria bacterium]|nr:hypothetical protein [Candidatus Riflebacteria bacterium]
KERIKEILGLTAEETSDLDGYKEIVSHIKERYSIDIENDIKQLTILFSSADPLFIVNGNFDTEKTLNIVKTLMKSEKWSEHEMTNFTIFDNKYKTLRVDEYSNLVFYDKNTLIFCKDSAEYNDSIRISKSPDFVNNIKKISNNFLYIGKDSISKFRNFINLLVKDLGNADNLLLYIKNKVLNIEADFKDPLTAKNFVNQINALLTQEQIEKYNQYIKTKLEEEKSKSNKFKKDSPKILFDLFESIYPQNRENLLSSLKVSQSENKVLITCNYETILSIVTTIVYPNFFLPITKQFLSEIRNKSKDSSKQGISDSETFKTLFVDNLPKDINELKGKLKNSSFIDCERFSILLYFHSKAKQIIDSIEKSRNEDGSITFLKNKDNESIFRFINLICLSTSMFAENDDEEYLSLADIREKRRKAQNKGEEYSYSADLREERNKAEDEYEEDSNSTDLDYKRNKKKCHKIQFALDCYNMDNTTTMTTPDIPLLLKKHYIKSKDIPDTDCEYYAVGDITRTGYISCKIHGSYQNRKPVPDKPEVIIHHGTMPKWLDKKSNNQNKTTIPPHTPETNQSPIPPAKSRFKVINGVPIPLEDYYQVSPNKNDEK